MSLKAFIFLNLLSTLLKTFKVGWPVQPSFTFSILLNEMSRYSSLGHLKAASSLNLLLLRSRYLRLRKLSSLVKHEIFLTLFYDKSRWIRFYNSFKDDGSGMPFLLRLQCCTSLASSMVLFNYSTPLLQRSRSV